ncbi:hypothetical protein FIBSPDRAFT_67852 [Athelia psychrophila]|uniref:Uncharacterized protein n=1 Tax=Athelia psychrophila TaxID=1759441 RepID=A0A166EP57_9AGAM|nr:hypothetical protein FIBSPDRAFT_67852 [Fibularhizoctonia sp. CBS 109695]
MDAASRSARVHVSARSRGIDKETRRTTITDILQKRQAQVFERGERGEEVREGGEQRAGEAAHVEHPALRTRLHLRAILAVPPLARVPSSSSRRPCQGSSRVKLRRPLGTASSVAARSDGWYALQTRDDRDIAQREPLERGEARHEPAERLRVRERRAVDSEGRQWRAFASGLSTAHSRLRRCVRGGGVFKAEVGCVR